MAFKSASKFGTGSLFNGRAGIAKSISFVDRAVARIVARVRRDLDPSQTDAELDTLARGYFRRQPRPKEKEVLEDVVAFLSPKMRRWRRYVRHPVFGLGEVILTNGSGEAATLTVRFRGGEVRELAAKSLEPG